MSSIITAADIPDGPGAAARANLLRLIIDGMGLTHFTAGHGIMILIAFMFMY